MYVRLVVSKDNIPFIYHIVVKLKAMSDAESPDFDKVRQQPLCLYVRLAVD